MKIKKMPNKCFNLINPLAWFVQEQQCTNHAKPSLRSGADLKVKPMLGRRASRAKANGQIEIDKEI
jgi:hypothetical protein